MNDEKIMILKMLDEGKIGADEAAKLLAAINNGEKLDNKKLDDKKSDVYDTTVGNGNGSKPNSSSGNSSIKFDELGRTIGNISKGMAKKMGVFAKEMTPKLQNVTETIVEKTVEVTDKISKSIATPPTPPRRPTPPPASTYTPPRPTPVKPTAVRGRTMEKSCEIAVGNGIMNELYITSKNGVIFIKGYNGDKITAKLSYTASNDNIELSQSGDRYYLDYDDSQFSMVSMEAYVPSRLFKRVHIIGTSSKITLDGITSSEIVIENEFADISLKNISSNYVKTTTDKGNIEFDNIVADSLEAITENGKIDASYLDVQKLKMETDNSPITYKAYDLKTYVDYNWRISTSNASMRITIPISDNLGYDIKANTSLNSVSIGISGLQYTYNESSYILAKTINFDRASKKVKLEVDTSNAPININ